MASDKVDIDGDIWATVQMCGAHDSEARYAEDCEHCEAERKHRDQIVEHLSRTANRTATQLAAHGIQMPPYLLTQIRLEMLIDAIIGDQRSRAQFEGECGRRVLIQLREAQRAMLAQPVQTPNGVRPSGLHVPKG